MASAETQEHLADYPRADLEAAARQIERVWPGLQGARLFLTGGTGFLGRWLLALLAHAGDTRTLDLRVICLSRDPGRFRTAFPALASHAAISLAEGDVRGFDDPKGSITHIIHGAADSSAAAAAAPLELLSAIVDGTRRVLQFAQRAGVPKLLFVSSGAVYGRQPPEIEKLSETFLGAPAPLDARSTYGAAKRLAEHLFILYGQQSKLEVKIARGFTFAGAGLPMDKHFAIGNFIRDAVAGKVVRVEGDGSPLRSYLYGADTAAWLMKILADGREGEAYNVGSDQAISIGALARRVADLLAPEAKVEILGQGDGKGHSRYVPDIATARALGLEIWTDLDRQIVATAEWHRRQAR